MTHFGGYVLHNIWLMHEEAQMPNMICSLSSLSLFFFFLFFCCQGGDGEYMSHKSVKGFWGAMHCTISDWRMKTHGCHTWFVPSLVSFYFIFFLSGWGFVHVHLTKTDPKLWEHAEENTKKEGESDNGQTLRSRWMMLLPWMCCTPWQICRM